MRGSPNEVVTTIIDTAHRDGLAIPVSLPEDPGQAGKAQIAFLTGQLIGYHTTSSRETGSKMTRAMPVASQVEARNVAISQGRWNHVFLDELRDFPDGRKDDQVDALTRGFEFLTRSHVTTRRLNTLHLAR
jgi:predicted phage terminase large subunit-like protein